jgi:hypothetical protein
MGYGPPTRQRPDGVPLTTVVLAIVCLVLAGLLALGLAGRHQASSSSTASASASPSGTDVPPAGAADAVAVFVGAWSLPAGDRDNALASVTATGVPAAVPEATAAQLAKTRPSEPAGYTRIDPRTVIVSQPLADGSTLELRLVFDPAASYGWLVSAVQLA